MNYIEGCASSPTYMYLRQFNRAKHIPTSQRNVNETKRPISEAPAATSHLLRTGKRWSAIGGPLGTIRAIKAIRDTVGWGEGGASETLSRKSNKQLAFFPQIFFVGYLERLAAFSNPKRFPQQCMPHYWYVSVDFQLTVVFRIMLIMIMPR